MIVKSGRLVLSACFAIGVFAAGCRQAPTPQPAPAPVVTATIEALSLSNTQTARYSGTVKPHQQVDLSFRVSGYVQNLLQVRDVMGDMRSVQAGDHVTNGTILARVESADYRAQGAASAAAARAARANADQARFAQARAAATQRQAQFSVVGARTALKAAQSQRVTAVAGVGQAEASVADAQTNVDLAQSTFARTEDLYQSASATRPQYDAAKANLDSAKTKLLAAHKALDAAHSQVAAANAQIDAAKARISEAQSNVQAVSAAVAEAASAASAARAQAGQAQAIETAQQIPVSETTIRTPISGVILARRVEVGTLVGPGSPAFTVADTSRLNVSFGIPEQEANRLHIGQSVNLSVSTQNNRILIGKITQIAPAADEKTGVFDVQVVIPNLNGKTKVGMVATLELDSNSDTQNALVAPISAIVQSRDKPTGYAVVIVENKNGQSTAHYQDIDVGKSYGDKIVVRGLAQGVSVATSSPSLLYDGQIVQVTSPSSEATDGTP